MYMSVGGCVGVIFTFLQCFTSFGLSLGFGGLGVLEARGLRGAYAYDGEGGGGCRDVLAITHAEMIRDHASQQCRNGTERKSRVRAGQ